MRSLDELRIIANGLEMDSAGKSREELMDMIRDRLGRMDHLQLDPMKAKDLKEMIDWGTDDPFARIAKQFLTPGYRLEPKLDGARMRLFVGFEGNRMNTGRRSDKTYAYLERSDNFRHLRDMDLSDLSGTIFDGEIMAPKASIDTGKVVTQGWLNSAVALVNTNPDDSWAIQQREGLAKFVVFDIIHFMNQSLLEVPYDQRRVILEDLFDNEDMDIGTSEFILNPSLDATEMNIRAALEDGFEGVVLKKVDGTYQPGKRSGFWLKIKQMSTMDVFITGWKPGEGRNAGKVGALICSVKDDLGLDIEIAQPGAFDDELRSALSAADGSLKQEYYNQVIEVMGQEVTKNGRLRHPQLVRFRPDKTADECSIEQIKAMTDVRD